MPRAPKKKSNVVNINSSRTAEGISYSESKVSEEEIARRAYEIYEARGGVNGSDVEDWLQAELELTQNRSQSA